MDGACSFVGCAGTLNPLLRHFDIHALGQIGEFTGCVSGGHGFAEGVKDLASGLAVLGVP